MIVGVQVAIFNSNGELLIAKRARSKKLAPEKWNLIGGRVEAGEAIVDAASREVSEEVGIFRDLFFYVGSKIVSWCDGEPFKCHTFISFSDEEPVLNAEHSEFKYLSSPVDYIVGYSEKELFDIFELFHRYRDVLTDI